MPMAEARFIRDHDHSGLAGGPPLRPFACTISTEGAPSLRFLQGWAAMLRVLCDLLCGAIKPSMHAFHTPALAKNARAGHPPRCSCRRNQKPGPPASKDQVLANGIFSPGCLKKNAQRVESAASVSA